MTEKPAQQPVADKQRSVEKTEPPAALIANRYEVVTKLSGGMAWVYLCRDLETQQLVALKTFKPELLSHRVARDLFLREGTMWVELGQHPNIVRAFRVERIGDGREVYLVLEWVVQPQGKATPALRSWLKPGNPLPVAQAILFSLYVARGMKFAARKISGLVHRDLKPENILIGHDGRARVADFGLASVLSGMSPQELSLKPTKENFGRTQVTQGVVGTPLYMAPEQWEHKPLDARADIYALGCILYEMVTGRFAAEGNSRDELREIHLAGRIKPPPATAPPQVILFLRKCLSADRSRRFSNWQSVEESLAELYQSVTGKEPPPEQVTATESSSERLAAGYSYNNMGLSYLDIGKLDVAVMYFEQAVGIGRDEGDAELEAQGLGNLGLAYMALGYMDRAIEFHEEHLALSRELGLKAEEGRALGNLGRAYRRLDDSEQAIYFHERELTIARDLKNRSKEAAALDSLGDTYRQLGDSSKAVTLFKQSLAIAREIGDRTRVKSILSSMGKIYLASYDLKEAMTLFQQSLDISRKLGDRVGEGEALGDLGDIHVALGDMARATELYRLALAIAEESNDRRKESLNLARLGEVSLAQDEAEEAIEHFESSLASIQETNDRSRELKALDKLGQAYLVFGDYMHAATLYRRLLEFGREIGDTATQQEALISLAKAYEQWGDGRKTAEYLEQHVALSREMGDLKSEVTMLNTLAVLYQEMQDLRAASEKYELYLSLAREAGNHRAQVDALNKLGDVIRERRRPEEACELFEEALAIAQEKGNVSGQALALSNLGLAYSELGKRWQATRYGEKGLKTALTTKDVECVAWARFKMALILVNQKKWSKAGEQAEKAGRLFKQIGEKGLMERMNKLLLRIQQQGGK